MWNSWVTYVVIFIIGQVVFLQTFKYVAKDSKHIGALTVLVQIISALTAIVFMCFSFLPLLAWRWPSGSQWWMWLLLFLSFILFAVNDRLDATCRKNLDISVDTMLHQIYRLMFFPMLILLLGVPFRWASLIGGIVIVFMNMLLIMERGKFKMDKYVILKLISVTFFAAALTAQLRSVDGGFGIPFVVFLSFGVPALMLSGVKQATPKTIYNEFKRKEWWLIIICGITQAAMTVTLYIFMTYPRADRIMINSFSAATVLLTTVFAIIFLKERKNLAVKIIASTVIVGALVFMAIGPF
jgi:uncharacterized membrane protein